MYIIHLCFQHPSAQQVREVEKVYPCNGHDCAAVYPGGGDLAYHVAIFHKKRITLIECPILKCRLLLLPFEVKHHMTTFHNSTVSFLAIWIDPNRDLLHQFVAVSSNPF